MADSDKAVAFIDSVPAGSNSMRGYNNEALTTDQSRGLAEFEASQSYSSILNSDATLPEKAKLMAVATKQKLDSHFSTLRPWSEFFDRSFFASPSGSGEAITRLNTNLRHFSSNYVVLSLVCSSYILLINLTFSICVLLAVGFYLYVRTCSQDLLARGDTSGQIYVLRRPFSVTQLYVMLAIFSALTFWLFNGGSVVFWLALTSLGVSCGHAVMRRPPLNNDEISFA